MAQPVILAAKRTPVGKFFGSLSKTPSPQLGAYAIEAVLGEVPGAAAAVDECIMGCVLQAGLGQNPARQAGLRAGLAPDLNAVTVNKVCGSGLQTVIQAAQTIKAGDNAVVVAGGFENMTAAPHLAYLRSGLRFGSGTLLDHMADDGLRCAFECWGMGDAADYIADKYAVTREEQDRFALQSHQRAAAAIDAAHFAGEIVPLSAEQLGMPEGCSVDEGVRYDSSPEALAKLRPAFSEHGTVTAGNSSQISDGAAALIVASAEKAAALDAQPLARIVDYYTAGVAPKEIFAAPISGIRTLLERNQLTVDDIDLFELNEAFAAQVLADIGEIGIPESALNVTGGGVALGHPIGASGARVLTTLLHQMQRLDAHRGVASLCLGGGNAVSMLVER